MIKTVVAGALLAVGGAIGAPAVVAHADPFIDYLVRNGEESSTAEMRKPCQIRPGARSIRRVRSQVT